MTTRGIRNNNPGNIDRNATKWQGMADDQSGDPRFVVFKAPEWGVRALAKTLLTYQNQHGLHTVRAIINRWAPPSENNTDAYVSAVAKAVGVTTNAPIDLESSAVMVPMVKAIIAHENAGYKYPDSVVMEGVRRAGVADAKPPPLTKSNTFRAQVVTGSAVGLGLVSEYATPVKNAADSLGNFTGSPLIQHIVTLLFTIAGLATIAGLISQWLKHRAKS